MNGRLSGGAVTLSEISIFPWSLVNLKDGAFFFFFLFLSFRFVSFRRGSVSVHSFVSLEASPSFACTQYFVSNTTTR